MCGISLKNAQEELNRRMRAGELPLYQHAFQVQGEQKRHADGERGDEDVGDEAMCAHGAYYTILASGFFLKFTPCARGGEVLYYTPFSDEGL